jgi:CCR4-NOT complex subunit CAF16
MLYGVPDVDPARREKIIKVMDINLEWRIHKLSDGQRRRLQIAVGLMKPYKVLLLDEVTTDLDVIARQDLLQFLKEETEVRGASILYATHIFDGIESWATDMVYIADQTVKVDKPISEVPELVAYQEGKVSNPLLKTVEKWLRAEKEERKLRPKPKEQVIEFGDVYCRKYADGTENPYAVAANRHLNK